MKKLLILFGLTLATLPLAANMASPFLAGTQAASPFVSNYVNITSETITIVPHKDLATATFFIEYKIQALQSGNAVPLLFYAVDYKDSFEVWFDNTPVILTPVPDQFIAKDGTKITGFDNLFQILDTLSHLPDTMGNMQNMLIRQSDLKFFNIDMPAGEHTIRVKYVARTGSNRSNWINIYSVNYMLAPARFWKSFGTLNVIINTSEISDSISTNLGKPQKADNNQLVFHFNAIPSDYLLINIYPQMPAKAQKLIQFKLENISRIIGVILFVIHLLLIYFYRKSNINVKFSWVMIVGSIVLPFLAFLSYPLTINYIDNIIGIHASKYHGYIIFIFFLYPLVVLPWWIATWLLDRLLARKLRKK